MKTLLYFLPLSAIAAAPQIETPAAFRDAVVEPSTITWKIAEPSDTTSGSAWWKVFGDAALDELVERALAKNYDLRAAAARVEQARAAAGIARSGYWPQVAGAAGVTREKTSSTTENVFPDPLSTAFRAPLIAAWEIDLFGRIRHLTASARAEAEASGALLEGSRLALAAEVATSVLTLRSLDQEIALVRDNVGLRRRARELAEARVANGVAAELDVARAEAELATAEAEVAALQNRRAAVEHAVAVLVGESAPEFAVPVVSSRPAVEFPHVPSGLPSALLERRPDIAAAERTLAAANARIGVARAAFFPAISLTGSAGFASGEIDGLFKADSRVWSIGPSLYLPIFQGGRNRANLARSRAAHDEAVAEYRHRVLVAFREVQDALTATRLLAEQAVAQDRAVTSARRAAVLAQTRYDAGLVSFLEVIDAQRTVLAAERGAAQLTGLRLNTGVGLIKALGGGWQRPANMAAR